MRLYFPVEYWLHWLLQTFCCYQLRRLALCAFIYFGGHFTAVHFKCAVSIFLEYDVMLQDNATCGYMVPGAGRRQVAWAVELHRPTWAGSGHVTVLVVLLKVLENVESFWRLQWQPMMMAILPRFLHLNVRQRYAIILVILNIIVDFSCDFIRVCEHYSWAAFAIH